MESQLSSVNSVRFLPQTWVPGKINLCRHIAQISPFDHPSHIPCIWKFKSGMSHDESSQLDTQVWILWSSQCATMCAWVSHFDRAFQVEMGTECQRTQPATKCDFLWVNVVTRPQPCDDTAWGKPGRIFYGLRLIWINFQDTSQQWFSKYYQIIFKEFCSKKKPEANFTDTYYSFQNMKTKKHLTL